MTTTPSPRLVTEPVTVILDPRVAYQGFGPDDSPLAAQVRRLDIDDSVEELADAAEQLDWAYTRAWETAARRTAPDITWDVSAPHHQHAGDYPLLPQPANAEDTAIASPGLIDEITAAVHVEFRTTRAGNTQWTVYDGVGIIGVTTVPWTIRSLQDQYVGRLASRIADEEGLLRTAEYDGLRLQLFDAGGGLDADRLDTDRDALGYVLTDHGQALFAGVDFHPSPLHAIDSDRTVEALAEFLSLRPGDTDDEYFANYTVAQLEWADGDGPERLWELIGTLPDTELAQMLQTDQEAKQVSQPVRVWRVKPIDRADLPPVNLLADTESNATAQYPGYVSAWLADTGRDARMDDDLFPDLAVGVATDATHDGRPVISPVRGQHTLDWAVEHANHWDTDAYVAINNLPEDKPVDIPATGVATVAIRNAHATAHAGARVEAHNRSHIIALADSHVEIHPGACVDRQPGSRVALAAAAHHELHRDAVGRQVDGSLGRGATTVTR